MQFLANFGLWPIFFNFDFLAFGLRSSFFEEAILALGLMGQKKIGLSLKAKINKKMPSLDQLPISAQLYLVRSVFGL